VSEERHIIEIDISKAIGEVLVEKFQAMGLVLVPETFARAAYQLADLLEERAVVDVGVSDEQDQAIDRLISQVAIARARQPGEQAT